MSNIVTRLVLENTDFARKLNLSRAQVKNFDKSMSSMGKAGTSALNSLTGGAAGMALKFGAAGAAVAAVGSAIAKNIKLNTEYESSLRKLSSLTGIMGGDLDALGAAALRLSSQNTQSATDIIAAFGRIGSAMPQLAKDQQGLLDVTQAAITLSDAAAVDMQTAVDILTSALNQYGASANEALDYTNILMAAQQNGAADVQYLATAIEACGSIAKASGISFAELVGWVEAIAPRFKSAGSAGNALKTVLAQLAKKAGEHAPDVVGFAESVKWLGETCNSAQDYVNLLGTRGAALGPVLVDVQGEAQRVTEAIQGTNTAVETAAANNDTLAAATQRLSNKWDNFILSLNNSTGPLAKVVNLLGDLVAGLSEAMTGATIKQGVEDAVKSVREDVMDYATFLTSAGMDKMAAAQESLGSAISAQIGAKGHQAEGIRAMLMDLNVYDVIAEIDKRLSETEEQAVQTLDAVEDVTAAGGSGSGKAPAGSIAALKAQISAAEKEYENATTDVARQAARELKEQLEVQLGVLEGKTLKIPAQLISTLEPVSQGLGDVQSKIAAGATAITPADRQAMFGATYQTRWQAQNSAIASARQQAAENPYNKGLQTQVRDMTFLRTTDQVGAVTDLASSMGDLAGLLGLDELSSGISDAVSAITTVMSIIQAVQTVQQMLSAGQVTAETANTAALAALTAAVLANTVAVNANSATSLLPFASGGIVGGSSFSGDNVPIRTNSGEMVLTRGQQANLFDMIGRGVSGSNKVNVQVEGVLTGETIYLQQRNYKRQTGR